MKTNRKAALLAFLALVLAFTVVSCSDPGHKTNAEVRVVGTAVSKDEKSRSVASELQFGSGEVWLGGNDITSSLVPAEGSTTDGQNNVEFVAEVPVIGETVTYSVKHEYGFVFDEWEIVNRNKIIRGEGDNWRNVLNEIWQATRGDSETIEIRPEYIKYIRPSFDRGIYVKSGENIGEKLKEYYSKSWNYDDDELTIKLEEGEFVLDLSEIKSERGEDEIELELKIIGGYDPSSWNITNRSTISEIKLPQSGGYIEEVELELEFRNISFAELDYNAFRTKDDFEIEFRNCSVETLKNARGLINGLMVKAIDKAQTGRALLIMNSVAPYVEGARYYHSIVMNDEGKTVDGENNIIVGGSGDSDNYYVASWNENSYKTDDPVLIDKLIQANPLSENLLESLEDHVDDMDDDFLEEDIEGRERFLLEDDEPGSRGIKVSYGPYEYQWFDD